MTSRSRFEIDQAALNRVIRSPDGPVARDMLRRGKRVEGVARRSVRVDTGRLRSSIHTELRVISAVPVARVGTDVSYARFVHDGTGLYGPRRKMITPKKGRYMVFTVRGGGSGGRITTGAGGRVVFARQVRGQTPNPFLTIALRAAG